MSSVVCRIWSPRALVCSGAGAIARAWYSSMTSTCRSTRWFAVSSSGVRWSRGRDESRTRRKEPAEKRKSYVENWISRDGNKNYAAKLKLCFSWEHGLQRNTEWGAGRSSLDLIKPPCNTEIEERVIKPTNKKGMKGTISAQNNNNIRTKQPQSP